MISQCVDQYACLAANINFNLDGLRDGFWQLTIDGLSWGAIYALVAVGYTLVYGVLKLINFAHSEVFMLGMFGAYFCLDMILGFTPSGAPIWQYRYAGPVGGSDTVADMAANRRGDVFVTGTSWNQYSSIGGSADDIVTLKFTRSQNNSR